MAKFLTTRGTISNIENIINDAQKRLVLISPFIRIPQTLFECIKDADRRRVSITLVYGKSDLNPDVRNQLQQLNNLSLHFDMNLHAKCFFNEKSMVITSMNLYDFSELNNKEMGILINSDEDSELYKEAISEAYRVVKYSDKIPLKEKGYKSYQLRRKQVREKKETFTTKTGFCIRCHENIPFNPEKPYCSRCFSRWRAHENPFYEEKYCHKCGKKADTTIDYPLCYPCYIKSRFT